MTDAQMLRSMLFTPGNRLDLVAKALKSGTDAVIVDLEDAVPVDSKALARKHLAELPPSDIPVFVRVNGAETDFLWPDVVAAGRAGVAGIVLPKADDPDLLRRIDGALTALETDTGREQGTTTLVPLVESSLGVAHAGELFTSSPRIRSVLFGSGEQGDLVVDLGCEWTSDGTGLLTARSLVLLAARAAGIEQPMDAVFMDFRNLDALRLECELAKRVGYVGKVAIHPAQVPVIHDVFTPTADEVEHERRLLDAFEEAVRNGSASISVDGRMVDYAVARRARSVLARAGAMPRDGHGDQSGGHA
ncbi:MAG: CoA ester lyase [Streptosporangiales bacterium]|nr:CoA ester lyase [Streptosporangiales bacterium]MBO0889928.1 CoA ester lyase [Acidothermales bacterium]